jgi:hypothetical protein
MGVSIVEIGRWGLPRTVGTTNRVERLGTYIGEYHITDVQGLARGRFAGYKRRRTCMHYDTRM